MIDNDEKLKILKKLIAKKKRKCDKNAVMLEALEALYQDTKETEELSEKIDHARRINPVIMYTENFILMYRNIWMKRTVPLDRIEEGIKNQILLEIRNGILDMREYQENLDYFAKEKDEANLQRKG